VLLLSKSATISIEEKDCAAIRVISVLAIQCIPAIIITFVTISRQGEGEAMKKMIVLLVSVLAMCCFGAVASAEKASNDAGATDFKEHCAICHPEGGNIIKIMRNPGPGMTAFDQKTISDGEAKDIAKYILKTFK
jgi:cytochrome c6